MEKHLPGREYNEENMGLALFLERRHWQSMEAAITNGIAKAFSR
ncbi:DUF6890 family protein [Pseudomaricurvus alkylphenolicus]